MSIQLSKFKDLVAKSVTLSKPFSSNLYIVPDRRDNSNKLWNNKLIQHDIIFSYKFSK